MRPDTVSVGLDQLLQFAFDEWEDEAPAEVTDRLHEAGIDTERAKHRVVAALESAAASVET